MEKEKQAYRELKRIYKRQKLHLAKLREENKPERQYSPAVGEIVRARKAGLFTDPRQEIHEIEILLDGDTLSQVERSSLNRRRKNLLNSLTTEE